MADPVLFTLPSEGVGPGGKPIPSNLVRFEHVVQKNEGASKAAGVPVHDQVLMGFVISPGNTRSEAAQVCARMKHNSAQWSFSVENLNRITKGLGEATAKFLAGEKPDIRKGTPLTEWPPMDARTVADLKAMNILTVEELAETNDNVITNIFGGVDLRNKARKHIDYANKNVTVDKLFAENDELKRRLAALEARLSDPNIDARDVMRETLSEFGTAAEAAKPKRGRPRKEAA